MSVAATSCSCTVGRLPSGVLQANEGQWLDITVNTAGKSGALNQTVVLRTGSKGEELRLKVKAIVEPVVDFQPREVIFLVGGEPQEVVVQISGDRPDLRILSVSVGSLPVKAEIRPAPPSRDGGSAKIAAELVVRPINELSQTTSGTLAVGTSDPRRPIVNIPVVFRPASSSSHDQALTLTLPPGATTATGTLRWTPNGTDITSASDPEHPGVPVSVKVLDRNGQRWLDISHDWDVRWPRISGVLVLSTSGKDIRVPYRVRITGSPALESNDVRSREGGKK